MVLTRNAAALEGGLVPRGERRITRGDLIPMDRYAEERAARRRAIMEVKRHRRVEVGPHASFYFESYETMLQQVLEMLYIEKGGEEQVADELAAYNPLIPQGREFVATLMFEIDDPVRRDAFLRRLSGVEESVYMLCGGEEIRARPERDVERVKDDGKASSVHFLHFPLTEEAMRLFAAPSELARLGLDHPSYGHETALSPETRRALAKDFL